MRPWSTEWSGEVEAAQEPRPNALNARTAATALLLAASYYGGAHAGFVLTSESAAVSLLWPPNALVLAALLLSPRRTWPVLIAAVLPAHLAVELASDVPLSMALLWFVSNISQAVIGAWGIQHFLGHPPRFVRFREFVVFLMWGVFLAPFLTSFLDAAFVAAVGWRYSDYWTVWRTRLLSNMLATLMLVPLIVIWVERGLKPIRRATRPQIAEASALFAGLCVTCFIVFWQQHPGAQNVMLLYVPLPFLIWAAMRLGVSGVSFCVAIMSGFAISGLLQNRGPFTAGDPYARAVALQVFLIIAAATLMLQSVSLAELRRARRAAERRRERLQLALAAARMGTWDWKIRQDRIVWSMMNAPASTPPLQSSVQQMLAQVHPDDRSRVSHALEQAVQGANHFDVEFRLQTAGDIRWLVAKGKLAAPRGTQRVLGVHMDVTERKSQEVQLQQQRDQLAHLSRVSMLGQLSGALAHELNQPLTAIMANAQAAYRGLRAGTTDQAELEDVLADIIAENTRAGEVIRRLRALFARGALELRPLNVNECVQDVLALEHSDLIARNVAVKTVLGANLPLVRADRVQLQQVLLNLIVNARDAMTHNGPGDRLLHISTTAHDGRIWIDICDHGTGIEDLDRIFEPFYTNKQHGLGLGLAICQSIIATHDGRLWATNNSDRGATMHVALPEVV